MTDRLELELLDLGAALATPAPGSDLAARIRTRITTERPRRASRLAWWQPPVRRSLVLAFVALVLTAAVVAAAIGFGLPGLRIFVGPVPSPTPPASPGESAASGAPGALLGLGTPVTLAEAGGLVDFPIALPPDPSIGPPDAVYLAARRLTLVWADRPGLPGTVVDGIGLLLVELHAKVDERMLEKIVDSGASVTEVDVDGAPGFWISGGTHELAYIGPDGTRIEDSRRLSGSTLAWTRDGITYRLEGELTKAEALELAATLP
jgi:hypothetical protein